MFGLVIVGECLLEPRAGEAIPDAARKIAQIEALRRGIWRTQEPLQAPLKILCANQVGFGFFFARLDQANRWMCRQGRKESLLRAGGVKFKSTV